MWLGGALLLSQLVGLVCGAVENQIITSQLKIGDTLINVTKEIFPSPSTKSRHGASSSAASDSQIQYAFLNLHENENTSVVASRSFLYKNGGSLVKFSHGSSRIISFYLKSVKYSFDPNRIFTTEGIIDTLKQYGPYSTAAVDEVTQFATSLLNIYEFTSQTVVLALHNNAGTYGANSYLPGGSYENDASAVYIEPKTNPSDFYYVVDPLYFDWFADHGYNVVLQNNETVTNDGSLSYYCGLEGKSYINFESMAEYSSFGAQVVIQLDMLYAVKEMLEGEE
jgi:hypothetical protein